MNWLIGAVCAALVAGAAYWRKSLTGSGMWVAIIMGTVYYGAGNLFWFGILLMFFITSTLLSNWRGRDKAELEKSYAKSGRRDAGQVLANGGLGMLLCICHSLWPDDLWIYLFIGVMATVTADTWATEWGGLSTKPPRSILTWKPIPAGTSGGVSLLGSCAAFVGGMLIGASSWLFLKYVGNTHDSFLFYLMIGGVGGTVGAFADSWFGATVQQMYRCNVCGKSVEVSEHCMQPTKKERGLRWMNNDAVNMLSSLVGGMIALLLGIYIR